MEQVKIKPEDILRYGPRGSAIPGSTLVREYCAWCGQAMRVRGIHPTDRAACEECSGTKKRLMPAGYGGPHDEDGAGSWGNTVRTSEEATE